jgi:2-hydroxychromene-2-carboxylate isomerase
MRRVGHPDRKSVQLPLTGVVGQLIDFSERIADRSRPSRGPAAFFFALGCPISYLAAERIERVLGEIEWVPIPGARAEQGDEAERIRGAELLLAIAEREAQALRLPLIAPPATAPSRPAARAALYAIAQGAGPEFALTVSRLIFCGGFDPEDPELLGQAAAASGLSPKQTLAASQDTRRDAVLDATAAGLERRGVGATPAIRIGSRWFEGVTAISGAASFSAAEARLRASASPAI